MNITSLILGVTFFIAGLLFTMGKIHILLTPWKNMPGEEKEKILIGPLCRNIGCVIVLSGILFMLSGIWGGFREHFFVLSMIIWFVLAGADLMYIEKSGRYQKNE